MNKKMIVNCTAWGRASFLFISLFFALISFQISAQEFTSAGSIQGAGISSGATVIGAGAEGGQEALMSQQGLAAGRQGSLMSARGAGAQGDDVPSDAKNIAPAASYQPEEPGEFENFVAGSVGKRLSIYGHSLFAGVPNTFSPLNNVPVTSDYLVGPGDEIVIRGWGQVDINLNVVVDRYGAIVLPKVGSINVAGIRYSELQDYLKQAIGRVFRNFQLSVTLGKLRSIQVFVVGQAKRPGAYTVSSLSTLVNTLFASGGPSISGSLRHIQVKRNGKLLAELDLYDFLLKGDKSKDISLLPGDVIYIPPAGHLSAIAGSVNNPAIYELKNQSVTLAELIATAGGLTTTAAGGKVRVEHIDNRKLRNVEEFSLSTAGLERTLKDGDVVQVDSISGQFGNAVTLRGNVASPGRYPWKEGMRVSDLIPSLDALIVPAYWANQNKAYRVEAGGENNLRTVVKRNQNEINWDYAVVERLKKEDMSTALLPFNLGKAIGGQVTENNLLLQPGDLVTIFSQSDIQVPVANRSAYVRLEGEVASAGVYKTLPGETLRALVARIGGFTPDAFLFGMAFERESVRAMQQSKLDSMLDKMEEEIKRNAASKARGSLSAEDVAQSKETAAAQLAAVAKMRAAKATGRVVLEIDAENSGHLDELPSLVLEDGDRLIVPPKPVVVGVLGMVYNENTFLFKPGKTVSDYLNQAGGPTRDADKGRIYLLRADGTVASSQNADYLLFFNSFSRREMLPGDALIVPEMLDKFQFTKELKDWSQIFYQFAIGVVSLKVLGAL